MTLNSIEHLFLVLDVVLHCIIKNKRRDIMTIFKTLNIQPNKQYIDVKEVRRHIGLTPSHAIAIQEIQTLNEMVNKCSIYPSPIINFAIETLINEIQKQDENKQIDFILDGINKYVE